MPRKREAESYDSDDGFVADAPKSKKSKSTVKDGKENTKTGALEARKGKVDGEQFWSVGLASSWVDVSHENGARGLCAVG